MSFRNSSALPFALIIAASLLSSCAGNGGSDGPTPVLSGPPTTTFPMPPASNASLKELGWITLSPSGKSDDAQRAKIGDYHGKVLVLDMYATWCAPCRESIPHLIELQRRYQPKGLEIVGLNVGGPDDRVKVADFAKELGINYTLGFPDRQLTDLLMSDDQSIPQTFVFDGNGKLVQRFVGYSEIAAGKLELLIQTQTASALP